MMKIKYIALCLLLVLVSCQRDEEMEIGQVSIGNEHLEASYSSVEISCSFQTNVTIKNVQAYLSTEADFSSAKSYSLSEKEKNTFGATIEGLKDASTYYVRYEVSNRWSSKMIDKVSEFKTIPCTIPTVQTSDVSDVTHNTAIVGGVIIENCGQEIIECGVVYSKSPNPSIENGTKVESLEKTESYACTLMDLEYVTTYYVRAYAINKKGVAYGEEVSFTTDKAPLTFTVNGVSFKMIAVQGGTFTMGATAEQGSDAGSDESPTHSVTLSDFAIGETEVTQELWKAVMGSNPSYFYGTNLPVEMVSWNDCQTFISKLNNLTGQNFRLPTEAEWEYAARGGNKSKGYKYADSHTLGDVAWYYGNSSSKTHSVKQKQANELGLYDMSGNVWEWCLDWYGSYSSSAQTNPTGSTSDSYRVLRGGSWISDARDCRVSSRGNTTPTNTYNFLGLRLALGAAIELEVALPTVTTSAVSQITETTAVAGGNVTSDGNATVTERGVVYSTKQNPTISDNKKLNGSGVGSFVCDVTNLQPNTTYYVRAYAVNSKGTAYGDEVSFTTAVPITLATVTTASITNITETTAKAGGTVTNDGNAAVTERGVCISTVSNPTTSNTKITAGSGAGSFTCNLTGLQANTTYYVRAYAVNSKGTAYGEEVSFTTKEKVNTDNPETPDIPEGVISCAEALAICKATGATSTTETYTIRGYVTEIKEAYNSTYGNISYWMADEKGGGQVLQAYRVKPVKDRDVNVKVNDYVEVVGTLVNYNGNTPKVNAGGTYTIITAGSGEIPETPNNGTENGYAYVDLGLSVKWATCNVGANNPEDYGDYFAWGETTTKDTYYWSTYKYCNGSSSTLTKYCNMSNYGNNGFTDNKTQLELSDDAARANWGGSWRMPTDDELTELWEQCTWTWTTQNGVYGRKVTSKTNGNSIFLPAAGYRNDSSLLGAGNYGLYWTSSLRTDVPNNAWGVCFNSGDVYGIGSRNSGLSVRPVCQ